MAAQETKWCQQEHTSSFFQFMSTGFDHLAYSSDYFDKKSVNCFWKRRICSMLNGNPQAQISNNKEMGETQTRYSKNSASWWQVKVTLMTGWGNFQWQVEVIPMTAWGNTNDRLK